MPNTPLLVKKGANVLARGVYATDEDVEVIKSLFKSVGICHEVLESDMDAVTGLSGSGILFIDLFIENY